MTSEQWAGAGVLCLLVGAVWALSKAPPPVVEETPAEPPSNLKTEAAKGPVYDVKEDRWLNVGGL